MRPVSGSARRARPLLGTFVEIAADGGPGASIHEAIDAAFEAVARVHRLMSFHDPSSDLGRLNREAWRRAVIVHPWTYAVLRAALDLHRASDGLFDVTVAPVLQRLGRLPGEPRACRPAPPPAATDAGFELLSAGRVRFRRPGVMIDLGGVAKGFAVDRALATLRRHSVTRGLVNAGGDLAAFGAAGELVALRDPRHAAAVLGQVTVRNEALASSGGGEAAIIDPRRAAPAGAVRGATVRARSCLLADALTKLVMIAGEAAGPMLTRYGASALFLSARGEIHVTREWSARVRRAS
jgi:thiamine biosynthesis lipoprotein